MSPVQIEARRKLAFARAHRRVLEEARCEGMVEGWDLIENTDLRIQWAQALLRETVAEVQARSLGVAS